jgi:hypothetical protein
MRFQSWGVDAQELQRSVGKYRWPWQPQSIGDFVTLNVVRYAPARPRASMFFRFAEHAVEPNSGLGQAISYMQKHWQKLTLFLRVPGAPPALIEQLKAGHAGGWPAFRTGIAGPRSG